MSFQKIPKITPTKNFSDFQKEHSLANQLPFWDFFDNCIALSDGTLVKGLKLKGLNTETLEDEQINSLTLKLRAFLNELPDGVEISFFIDKHSNIKNTLDKHQSFVSKNPEINKLSKDRIKFLTSEALKENILNQSIFLFIYKRPDNKINTSVFDFFKTPQQFQSITKDIHNKRLKELLNLSTSISETLKNTGIKTNFLSKKESLNIIYKFLNPERVKTSPLPKIKQNYKTQEFTKEELQAVPELSYPSPCEQLLFSDIISGHQDLFYDNHYHRILTLKTLPEYTYSSLVSKFLAMPFSYNLFLHIKVPNQAREISLIQARRRMAHSMSSSHNGRVTDLESEAQVSSTEELLQEIIQTGEKIFFFQMAVKIKDKNKDELELKSKKVLSFFRNLNSSEGFVENVANFKTFKSVIPFGNLAMPRAKRIKSSNLADFLPIYSSYTGGEHKPLCLFRNREKALVNYDPFHPKLSNYNSLVTGSSGSGKSFLNNLILLQSLKEDSMSFIIDIGGSYKKLCNTLGGQYVDVSPPNTYTANPITINPFQLSKTEKTPSPRKIKFLLALLESLLVDEEREKLPKLEKALLEEQINILYVQVKNPTLSDFKKLLKWSNSTTLKKFSKMLYSWTGDTPYGQLLDSQSNFNINSDFVVFDLKGLSNYPDLQAVMLLIITNFILDKIESNDKNIKGLKKRILMDECWELLKSKSSANFMEYCVRTLRKTGSGITFITQGVEEIASHPIGSAILGNTATKFVLMQKGDLDVLKNSLKLNEREVELVSSLQSKKEEYAESFMVVGDDKAVIRVCPSEMEYKIANSEAKSS